MYNNAPYTPGNDNSGFSQASTKQSIEDVFAIEYNKNDENKTYQEDVIIRYIKNVNNGYDKSRIIYQVAICPFRQYKYQLFQLATIWIEKDDRYFEEIRKAFTVNYFKELIENCEQLEVIGLALKLYKTIHKPTNQYQQQQQQREQFKDQVVEFLDCKIEQFAIANELDTFFLTDILQQLAESKINQGQGNVQKFKPIEIKELCQKIYTIIDDILILKPEKLQSLNTILLKTLMKYLLILPSISYDEIRYVQIIIDLMMQFSLTSGQQSYDVSKLTDVYVFIFKAMKTQWDNRDLIRPNQNIHQLIETLGEITQQYLYQYSFDVVFHLFNPKETVTILNNFIDCGYTTAMCNFIYQIIRSLLQFRRYDVLSEIHVEFILKRIINKIQCNTCIRQTLALIKETLFGFSKNSYLTDDQVSILLKQYGFIIKFKAILTKEDLYYLHEFFYLISKNQDLIKGLNSQSKQSISDVANFGIENKYIDLSNQTLKQRVERMLGNDIYFIESNNKIQPTQQLSGLVNLGQTCYINSFIHSIYHATKFRDFILYYKPHIDKTKIFASFVDPIEEIMKVFLRIHCLPNQQDIDPKPLKSSLPDPFRSSTEQQDSGEFGKIYFEYIQNYLKDTESKDQIDKLFFGKIENITQCQQCKTSYKNAEKILDIIVNFSDSAFNKQTQQYDLIKMMKNAFKPEMFDENNAYFCEVCQKKTSAIKNTLVKELPPFLTISVGRFQFDNQRQERIKLLNQMNLPETIKLQEIFEIPSLPQSMNQQSEYELFAFIVHLGSKIDAGHYIAYCKNLEDQYGRWKLYDDNFVGEQTQKNANDIIKLFAESETPYILFYANKKQQSIELHKYIDQKNQIYQNVNIQERQNNYEQNGYFYNQNPNNDISQGGNRFQNNYKK